MTMTPTSSYTITTRSVEETQAWGQILGHVLRPGDVVALQGELGAGKTAFTQGIGLGLGVKERITSPTFTLVNEYTGQAGMRLIHTDSYRLGDMTGHATDTVDDTVDDTGDDTDDDTDDAASAMQEAATFGMADILDSVQEDGEAVIVIEWAERLADLLPDGHLTVALAHVPAETDLRTLTFAAHGPRAEGLVDHLRDRGTL